MTCNIKIEYRYTDIDILILEKIRISKLVVLTIYKPYIYHIKPLKKHIINLYNMVKAYIKEVLKSDRLSEINLKIGRFKA